MRNQKRKVTQRCRWAIGGSPLYLAYHDSEWGAPQHDDRVLFEFLILEGAQAGLSWSTVLNKRENYRNVFAGFDPGQVAGYDKATTDRLMQDSGIVRNRLKVEAAVINANAFLEVQKEWGSFDAYIWRFVGGTPRRNAWTRPGHVPAFTAESDAMSKDLKRRGFKFVGSTIIYAFMQATGMVNDHTRNCFRWEQLDGAKRGNRS
jgi:DNA-3-methyladenine glycosylase I